MGNKNISDRLLIVLSHLQQKFDLELDIRNPYRIKLSGHAIDLFIVFDKDQSREFRLSLKEFEDSNHHLARVYFHISEGSSFERLAPNVGVQNDMYTKCALFLELNYEKVCIVLEKVIIKSDFSWRKSLVNEEQEFATILKFVFSLGKDHEIYREFMNASGTWEQKARSALGLPPRH